MMRNSDYWRNRFDLVEQSAHNYSINYSSALEEKYKKAMHNLDLQINAWYNRFAINNQLTPADARRILNGEQLKELKWSVKEYIKYGKENSVNQQWLKELENASAKFHINRLEALKLHCRQQIEVLAGGMVDDLDEVLRNVYSDAYYKSMFNVQRGVGVGFDVGQIDVNKLATIVRKPWTSDGQNFSDRIWNNRTKLVSTLDQELSRMAMTGEAPIAAIKNLERTMNTSRANATRLVMTEGAFFTTVAQKDAFKELDVEEFEVVGTLDSRTLLCVVLTMVNTTR